MRGQYWIAGGALFAIAVVGTVATWQAPSRGESASAARSEHEPPALEPLRGLPTPSSSALALTGVTTTDSDQHRLRLRLPAGVGGICELAARAPDNDGHAVIWKPRLGERFARGKRVDVPAGKQTWELTTDDGRRQYFYGIEVTTHLHWAGTPRWHGAAHTGDTPWVVDIADLLGHRPDPDTPADRFFERTRFLNARGEPLRPMRQAARGNVAHGDAVRELSTAMLDDYMTPDGRIRFWGRVKRIRWVESSGTPIDRRWHERLENYE